MTHSLLAEPRGVAAVVAIAVWLVLALVCIVRARRSLYPSLLYSCLAYMTLLHAVWIYGLLTSVMFSSAFGTLSLLTFPWSIANAFTLSLAGFETTPDLLLNYARYVLGFGGLNALLITLFVWEMRPRLRKK